MSISKGIIFDIYIFYSINMMCAEEAAMEANEEEIEIKHEPLEPVTEEDVSMFKV